jgi:hypothetical protein
MLRAAGLIRLLIRALAKIGNWRRWCLAPRRISSSLLVLSIGFGADRGRGEEIGVMLGFFVSGLGLGGSYACGKVLILGWIEGGGS